MHMVVFSWFGGSAVWLLPLLWRLAKSVLPGGAGLRGPGTIRIWLGFVCVMVASCTLEASLIHIAGVNGLGHALATGFGHLLGPTGTPLAMLAVLLVTLPWLIGFRWSQAAAWADGAFGLGLSRNFAKRDDDSRPRRATAADHGLPTHAGTPTNTMAPKSNGRYARPTVWRPNQGGRASTSAGAAGGVASAGDARAGQPPANAGWGSNARATASQNAESARSRAAQPPRQDGRAPWAQAEPVAPAGWLRDPATPSRGTAPARDSSTANDGRRGASARTASMGSVGVGVASAASAGGGAVGTSGVHGASVMDGATAPATAAPKMSGDVRGTPVPGSRSSTTGSLSPSPVNSGVPGRPGAGSTAATSPSRPTIQTQRPAPRPVQAVRQPAPGSVRAPAYSRPAIGAPRVPPSATVQETLRSIEENAARWTTLAGAGLARMSSAESSDGSQKASVEAHRAGPATANAVTQTTVLPSDASAVPPADLPVDTFTHASAPGEVEAQTGPASSPDASANLAHDFEPQASAALASAISGINIGSHAAEHPPLVQGAGANAFESAVSDSTPASDVVEIPSVGPSAIAGAAGTTPSGPYAATNAVAETLSTALDPSAEAVERAGNDGVAATITLADTAPSTSGTFTPIVELPSSALAAGINAVAPQLSNLSIGPSPAEPVTNAQAIDDNPPDTSASSLPAGIYLMDAARSIQGTNDTEAPTSNPGEETPHAPTAPAGQSQAEEIRPPQALTASVQETLPTAAHDAEVTPPGAPSPAVPVARSIAPWEIVDDTIAELRTGSSMTSHPHTQPPAHPTLTIDTPQHVTPVFHVVAAAAVEPPAQTETQTATPEADAPLALSNIVRFPGMTLANVASMFEGRAAQEQEPVDTTPANMPGDESDTPPAPPVIAPPPPRGHAPTGFEFHAPAASMVELPSLDLLERTSSDMEPIPEEKLAETGQLIEQRLQEFKVPVTVVGASAGPVITRFEVEPALGVRGSQIVGLMKDLSRGLGLTSIRVVETIPGKTCMGLELPNAKRQMIRLSEILQADVYQNSRSNLTLAMGKDITGHPVVADLAKAPHMLVAGTTGSGKSVAINAMIVSLLYKATPEEVRLIMIDPKMLELSVYEGIPHLLAPVVTDMKLAANALNWCVGEMEKRYRLMSAVGVRNLAGFNQKIRDAEAAGKKVGNPFSLTPEAPEPLAPLPLIVVVIDELADLMMVAGKKIEELIARLAQKARAAGIHLILATQRPSVDVITGLIKANIPTRVAFQVSSKIDSRTILDQMGAESLLGQGDMLFLPPGTGYPQRVHGAFVEDEEVHRIVEYLKQFGEPQYEEGILDGPASEGAAQDLFGDAPDAEADPLYDEAVAFVVRTRRASISSVQRQLRIGYNRAARLVEQMETAGLVSPMGINGSREVLAPGSAE